MDKKTLSIIVVAIAIGAAFAGYFAGSAGTREEQGAGTAGKMTIRDLAGRTVTVDKPVEKIVVTWDMTEYFAVGGKSAVDKLVGWNKHGWKKWRPSVWKKYSTALSELKGIPNVGASGVG